jgi:hypothetical protein
MCISLLHKRIIIIPMKNIVIAGAVLIVILTVLYFYTQPKMDAQPNTSLSEEDSITETQEEQKMTEDTTGAEEPQQSEGKLKADTFSGTLQSVDTGCFADGECFVVVDGKHVTVLRGWSRDTVGSVIGADGIGGLEAYIGQEVEVYAQDNSDGTYTLYGSEGFYIKAK